jgi:hypothetical protein
MAVPITREGRPVAAFVQSFQLVATGLFVVGSAVVGLRLLWLAHRTGEAPELLLGGAILGTAVLGYGTLIASLLLRGGFTTDPARATNLAAFLTGTGKVCHDAGVTLFLAFVLKVFRPGVRWARGVAGTALLFLWGGVLWGGLHGSFRVEVVGSPAWLCEYAVIWAYPVWMVLESFRYWGLLRRRTALGLADPIVTNRFLLWGTGSLFTALATWVASAPYALAQDSAALAAITPAVRVITAAAGVVSVGCSYLAFVPPAWYLRRMRAGAAA